MKKLLFLLVLLVSIKAYGASEWTKASPAGADSPSDIDTLIQANNEAIDRLLSNYREGCKIEYLSASSLTVELGEVVCSNSDGTARRFRKNTSDTTVTWSDLDTGSEATSTTYYVYAVADADATTFTVKISESSTAPSGMTYDKRLGSFYNNADGDIEQIRNDDTYMLISTGTIANGGTIPLPSGYSQSQCKWIVSPAGFYAWGEYAADNGDSTMTCTVNSNRVVTVTSVSDTAGSKTHDANYMIIGYR